LRTNITQEKRNEGAVGVFAVGTNKFCICREKGEAGIPRRSNQAKGGEDVLHLIKGRVSVPEEKENGDLHKRFAHGGFLFDKKRGNTVGGDAG